MILYLDASALVKAYVEEVGSPDVRSIIDRAETVGTAAITRVEVSAGLARAARMEILSTSAAEQAVRQFRLEWVSLLRIRISDPLIRRADDLVWQFGLRGNDAVHLSAALVWQESLAESVSLATYDQQLWEAGRASELEVWPVA